MGPESHLTQTSEIDQTVLRCAKRIDIAMRDRLAHRALPANLRAAMEHALLAGGKRLRPALTLLACEAAGGNAADAVGAAVATEFVHAFSLVHDDLPAMDDDDLRRGLPTVHVKFGEAMAILAGDALLNEAFAVVVDEPRDHRRSVLLRELTDATGAMIAGQVYDTIGGVEGRDDAERLQTTHSLKTGALIRASCRMGAFCADADELSLAALTDYAEAVGLMYQIVDDLLDVEQTPEHAGKRTGKDELAGKLTYPRVLGVQGARERIGDLLACAEASLAPLRQRGATLDALARQMAVRTR
jgi:geranylgeranyl pyrophosphate synthase